jgi:hypothetical protein
LDALSFKSTFVALKEILQRLKLVYWFLGLFIVPKKIEKIKDSW